MLDEKKERERQRWHFEFDRPGGKAHSQEIFNSFHTLKKYVFSVENSWQMQFHNNVIAHCLSFVWNPSKCGIYVLRV